MQNNVKKQERKKQIDAKRKKQKVKKLLEKARKALSKGRLQTPSNDNAMKWVNEVKRIAPRNGAIISIVSKVIDKYITFIKSSKRSSSKEYYKQVRKLRHSFNKKQRAKLGNLNRKYKLSK